MQQPAPAYQGNDAFVFVCYSHADIDVVYPEIARLQNLGFNVWYDEGIEPGSEWSAVLADAISRSSTFLYFVTPNSVASEHCRREVNFALEETCDLLAVHLEKTTLSPALKLSLSHRQGILRFSMTDARYEQKLVGVLNSERSKARSETPAELTIGAFALNVGSSRLVGAESAQTLEPKDLNVLLHLIEGAPDVVSTEELLERNWPGSVVGDNALHQVIARLRRAFGDDARSPEYIETLPRRGYRLMAGVAEENKAPVRVLPRGRTKKTLYGVVAFLAIVLFGWWQLGSESTPAPPVSPGSRVVVLPFEDLTPAGDLAWLANGLALELSAQIENKEGYTVPPWVTTSAKSPGELGTIADIVLTGSVQESDRGIVLRVEATDLHRAERLWTESFDGTRESPYDLQRQLALRVSRYFHINAQALTGLPEMRGPKAPEARTLYLQYLHHRWGGDPAEIEKLLPAILAIDPTWAQGHIDLTLQYMSRINNPDREQWIARAKESLANARDADGEQKAFVYFRIAQAEIAWKVEGDLDATERYLHEMAMVSEWPLVYAQFMLASGLTREAHAAYEAFVARGYRTVPALHDLAIARASLGDLRGAYDAMIEAENALPPHTYSSIVYPLMLLLPRLGLFDEAERHRMILEELAEKGGPGSMNARFFLDALNFELAIAHDDMRSADLLARQAFDQEDYLTAAARFLLLGDEPSATRAYEHPGYFAGRDVSVYVPFIFDEQQSRFPPLLERQKQDGYTDEWRHELCQRAATLPKRTGITCNPDDYPLDNYQQGRTPRE